MSKTIMCAYTFVTTFTMDIKVAIKDDSLGVPQTKRMMFSYRTNEVEVMM